MTNPRILVIDNVDSFTFMLVDYLLSLGAGVEVARNDSLSADEALAAGADGILISPGPGAPGQAGISVEMAALCIARRRPLLGVCLGHQAIALACGAQVVRTVPMHGKVASVRHDGTGLFERIPSPLSATRYHSLAATEVKAPLIANAWSDDGTVMGLRHQVAPVHGIQFHPESIASDHGETLLSAFVDLCRPNA